MAVGDLRARKKATVKLRFVIDKTTSGTVRYREEPELAQPVVCGTLYVRKDALRELAELRNPDGSAPESFTIEITPGG